MKKILIALFAVALLTGCECLKDDKAPACKKGSACCVKAKAAGTTCKALKATKCKMKMKCKKGSACCVKAKAAGTTCKALKATKCKMKMKMKCKAGCKCAKCKAKAAATSCSAVKANSCSK